MWRRTCSPVGGFPEGRTALGEGTEHLRTGGWTDTPDSESGPGVRSPAILKNISLTALTICKCIIEYVSLSAFVANALFHVHECVGNYTLPLDHSVLVRSDI